MPTITELTEALRRKVQAGEIDRRALTMTPEQYAEACRVADLPGDPQCEYCRGLTYYRENHGEKLRPCPKCSKAAPVNLARPDHNGLLPADYNLKLSEIVRCSSEHMAANQELARLASTGGWLWLHGAPGTGKTLFLKAAAALAAHRGRGVQYTTAADLLLQIKSTFTTGEQAHRELLRDLAETPVLCLDEVGANYVTDWAVTELFGVLDRRYQTARAGAVTLFASNAHPAEIDARLASRASDGAYKIIEMVVNLRQKP
jgi:chromosomal replication initiation ATPase DnaA